jgi:hypothetical protein
VPEEQAGAKPRWHGPAPLSFKTHTLSASRFTLSALVVMPKRRRNQEGTPESTGAADKSAAPPDDKLHLYTSKGYWEERYKSEDAAKPFEWCVLC